MRFHKTLDNKFAHIEDKHTEIRKPAVSATLRAFLQNESLRIDHVIEKKKMCNEMLKKIANESLTYRDKLRSQIQEAQEKHETNREKFLEKRVKGEKFKLDQVERKRKQLMERIKEKRRSTEQNFKRHKSQTVQFWKTKDLNTKKSYELQTSVSPLYEDATSRKKFIERRNEAYAEQQKDRLLARHSEITQRIESIVIKKQQALEEYNQKLQEGYFKNLELMENRQKKIINSICLHRRNSDALLRKNKKQYQKKLQIKHANLKHTLQTQRQNFTERSQRRTQSMKQCRCHKKGPQSPDYMTRSIALNEQEPQTQPHSPNKTKRSSWSVMQSHRNFMMQSQTNLSAVKNNKSLLKERKDLNDERKLMTEKEIGDAVRTREEIKNQSNLMVRQARVLA